jgi:hypothetical protein
MSRLDYLQKDSWPMRAPAVEPWAGDEMLDDPAPHRDYARHGGTLDEAGFRAADQAFLDAYRAVLAGTGTLAQALAAAEVLHVPLNRTHDTRSPQPSPYLLSDAELCVPLEDLAPDAPLMADRVLGPWVDANPDRGVRQAAAGVAAFWHFMDGGASPVDRYRRAKPRPPLPQRRAMGRVEFAPAMLWDLDWTPLLPLHPRHRPTGPVHADVHHLMGGASAAVVARLVPLESGEWFASCAIGLPTVPDLAWLERRVHLELIRHRRHDRRSNWETLLRDRCEVLYRSCATWCWRDTEPS